MKAFCNYNVTNTFTANLTSDFWREKPRKERVMYYFEARYLNPPTFISRDPLFEAKPWMSPYAYCRNNPLIYIDPNGEDEWKIYGDGTIERKENKNIDRIDVVDKNGNITKGTEVKYGTIKQHTTKINITDEVRNTIKTSTIDYFEIQGDALAKETFENIANNTSIEWGHAKIGSENSDKNIVGTSHEKQSTSILGFLYHTNYTLKEITHNHPSGDPRPSEADMKAAETFQHRFPNIQQNIYIKNNTNKKYFPYNKEGQLWGTGSVTITPRK